MEEMNQEFASYFLPDFFSQLLILLKRSRVQAYWIISLSGMNGG